MAGVHLTERPQPDLTGADDVVVDVLQVGICGTDRDEAAGGRAEAAPGLEDLVIGHELLGRIVAVGPAVRNLVPGSLAALTVRRPCPGCASCDVGRPDMCYSGNYAERGIKGLDGYQAERVVESACHVLAIPATMFGSGVLVEPLSISEKAIEEALSIQAARLPDRRGEADAGSLDGRRALVAGLGPVGLLAAIALRLRGAEVAGLDVVDRESPRAQLLSELGGVYLDGRQITPTGIEVQIGRVDFIFEATGVPALEFDLIDALGTNGIYMLTGIAAGDRPLTLDGAELMRRLVLRNQVIVGSVNASRAHFEAAIADLQRAEARWPGLAEHLVTRRVPAENFAEAFDGKEDNSHVKTVVDWQRPGTTGGEKRGEG